MPVMTVRTRTPDTEMTARHPGPPPTIAPTSSATAIPIMTEAQMAMQTSALATAVALLTTDATEGGETEAATARISPKGKTSTVPKSRDVHEMTLCPSGLLRWTLLIFQSEMLNLIKVLRLSEESMGLLFHGLGKFLCHLQLSCPY